MKECSLSNWFIFCAGACAALLMRLAIDIAVMETASSQWRKEAVKHGAAEFYLDENHNRQWRWLDQREKK